MKNHSFAFFVGATLNDTRDELEFNASVVDDDDVLRGTSVSIANRLRDNTAAAAELFDGGRIGCCCLFVLVVVVVTTNGALCEVCKYKHNKNTKQKQNNTPS
jgi:hypothetical protein